MANGRRLAARNAAIRTSPTYATSTEQLRLMSVTSSSSSVSMTARGFCSSLISGCGFSPPLEVRYLLTEERSAAGGGSMIICLVCILPCSPIGVYGVGHNAKERGQWR